MHSLFLYWSEHESNMMRVICQSQVNNLPLSNANKYIQYHGSYITKYHYYLFVCCFIFSSFPCNQNNYVADWWANKKLHEFRSKINFKRNVFNLCCRSTYKLTYKYFQWQCCTLFPLNILRKLIVTLDKDDDKTCFSMK